MSSTIRTRQARTVGKSYVKELASHLTIVCSVAQSQQRTAEYKANADYGVTTNNLSKNLHHSWARQHRFPMRRKQDISLKQGRLSSQERAVTLLPKEIVKRTSPSDEEDYQPGSGC
jgi:hypothetical protein